MTRIKKRKLISGIVAICSLLLFFAPQKSHANAMHKKYEIRESIGARSMLILPWLLIPGTLTLMSSFDYGKCLKLQVELSPYSFVEKLFEISVSGGAGFKVHGNDAAIKGGWEVTLPLLAEVGFLKTTRDAFDYGNDILKWGLLGLSSGLDFTWWSSKKIGFNISLKISYLFRIVDADSDYAYEDSKYKSEFVGFPDVALTFGIAL
jgi:hypothetical protein